MSAEGYYPLPVSMLQMETDHAVRVGFDISKDISTHFKFKQGQYVTLQMEINKQPVRRSYSICSGIDEKLQVAIKRVEGGLFSNYMHDNLSVGDIVLVRPPEGNFYLETDVTASRKYLFIAAGSGITPVISNIKTILDSEPKSEVCLLYGNQSVSTMMFRDALGFIKNRHLSRFHWINVLSREDQGSDILSGRLNNKKGAELNQHLVDLSSFDAYFICGPESMISEVSRGLRSLSVDDECIKYELFASSAEDARLVVDKHQERSAKYGGHQSDVTLRLDARTISINMTSDGENVLDAAIGHGLDLPHSCKSGVCSTCKARLIEGEVDMDITHGLSIEEIDAGFILCCQAHPISDKVTIDFDRK